MATTSTLHTARAALVSQLDTGILAGNVFYAWPGPEVSKGRFELVWIDAVVDWAKEIPNIKAGRKQRQENYTFELVIHVAKPELTAAGAEATDQRALELLAVVDNTLADDVQLGQADLHWLIQDEHSQLLIPNETGWLCQIVVSIDGQARLT